VNRHYKEPKTRFFKCLRSLISIEAVSASFYVWFVETLPYLLRSPSGAVKTLLDAETTYSFKFELDPKE